MHHQQEIPTLQLPEISMGFRRVLVLEDNFIIAMEAEDILRSLGVEDVVIATNVQQAETLISEGGIDFALLDVNLGAETSFVFAERLREVGVPFGFVTGYGESAIFPMTLRLAPRITKPFNEASLGHLLASASEAPGR